MKKVANTAPAPQTSATAARPAPEKRKASVRKSAPAPRARAVALPPKGLPHKDPESDGNSLELFFDEQGGPYVTEPPSRRDVLPVAVEWKERMRAGELFQAFRRFFDVNEIGPRLVATLREGSGAVIEFEGDPQPYGIVKERGQGLLRVGRPDDADVHVRLTRRAVEALLAPNATRPDEYIDRLVVLMEEKWIQVRLLSSTGDAMRKGYLGVVAAGGRSLADGLVRLGFPVPAGLVRRLR